jgi:hypothetical protein
MPIADRSFKRLTEKNVNRSPRKRGVYALYRDRTLIFLGKAAGEAETIRSRLRSHLDANAQPDTRYKRELTRSPAARLKVLVEEYVERHGRLPKLNAAQP